MLDGRLVKNGGVDVACAEAMMVVLSPSLFLSSSLCTCSPGEATVEVGAGDAGTTLRSGDCEMP